MKANDMTSMEQFELTYKKSPEGVGFCPYRVCPIGAHSDHQYGKITGLAIDKGVYIVYGPTINGVVAMRSLQFSTRAQWHICQVEERPVGDWADYLRGATKALAKMYPLNVGICGVIEGAMPIGGPFFRSDNHRISIRVGQGQQH